MGIHSHIAVQLSLIGQSQSHGSKSAYRPRSRGLCRRKLQRWLQLQLRPSELRLQLHHRQPRLPQEGSRALLQPALAYHPAGGYGYNKYGPGYSYTYRSTQGLHKREADHHCHNCHHHKREAEHESSEDVHSHIVVVEPAEVIEPHYEPALAYHPAGGYGYKYGPGYSYTYRSPQGLHKREAEASEPHYEPALAYHPAGGYGYNKYGPGYSY